MISKLFKTMSGANSNRQFAKTHDLWAMAHLLILISGLTKYTESFRILTKRMVTLIKSNGKKFLVLYLKEAVRMVIAFLNHQIYVLPKGGVEVRKDRRGLPMIVPGVLRHQVRLARDEGGIFSILCARAVLTVLSFYRVLAFKAKPDLGSITAPFSGIAPLFPKEELGLVISMIRFKKLGRLTWFISESAGPNGPKATWFSFCDAVSFLYNPREWVAWVCYALLAGYWGLLIWFVSLQILALPFLPLIGVIMPGRLGCLAALPEGAGKVRIVAITDWWTQMLFRPLHDMLFATLKEISQDGTHNQWDPVERHVIPRAQLGYPVFSYDLSSATDRLPVAAQEQILSLVIGWKLARAWRILLDRNWWFRGQPYRYAVGQPMGAYSSWAMLAIMHHIVVQMAALRSGWREWFPHYAIVGDDIVIADKDVAGHYLALMRSFGVSISLHKSIVSEVGLLEFAKRWYSGMRGDLSMIGPGLLLAVLKNISLLPVLVLQMFQRKWLHFPEQVERVITYAKKIRNKLSASLVSVMIATVLGPSGLLKGQSGQVTAIAELWFARLTNLPLEQAIPVITGAFSLLVMKDVECKDRQGEREWTYFSENWFRKPLFRLPDNVAMALSAIPILVSPAFWLYYRALEKGLNPDYSASLNLIGLEDPKWQNAEGIKFDLLETTDLASIDWKKRPVVKKQLGIMADLPGAIAEALEVQRTYRPIHSLVTAVVPYRPDQFRLGDGIEYSLGLDRTISSRLSNDQPGSSVGVELSSNRGHVSAHFIDRE